MKIELVLDGKKKSFKSKTISVLTYHKAMIMQANAMAEKFMNGSMSTLEEEDHLKFMDDYYEFVDLVVVFFGKQFTADEFMEGFQIIGGFDHSKFVFDVLHNIQTGGMVKEVTEGKTKDQPKK